ASEVVIECVLPRQALGMRLRDRARVRVLTLAPVAARLQVPAWEAALSRSDLSRDRSSATARAPDAAAGTAPSRGSRPPRAAPAARRRCRRSGSPPAGPG